MKKLWSKFKEALYTINFDGLRCTIKGDPRSREIMGALKRKKEIDNDRWIPIYRTDDFCLEKGFRFS